MSNGEETQRLSQFLRRFLISSTRANRNRCGIGERQVTLVWEEGDRAFRCVVTEGFRRATAFRTERGVFRELGPLAPEKKAGTRMLLGVQKQPLMDCGNEHGRRLLPRIQTGHQLLDRGDEGSDGLRILNAGIMR